MANMLRKSAPWIWGCNCSRCSPAYERRAARQAARRREQRRWQRDIDD